MNVKVEELSRQAADTTTGAVISVVEAAANPVQAAGRQVRRLERKGQPANTQARRRATTTVNHTADKAAALADGTIAERLVLAGFRVVKSRARRQDAVGEVAFRYLEFVNGQVGNALRSLRKLDGVTTPPVRNGGRRTETPVRRAVANTTPTARKAVRRSPRTSARRAPRTSTQAQRSA